MDIAEKRVFDDATGRTRLAVATGAGLAVVAVSDDIVGEFGLALRGAVRDVVRADRGRALAATADGLRAVAVPEDGLADAAEVTAVDPTPTTAVAVADDAVVAVSDEGAVRRTSLAALEADPDWEHLGDADVRAADGPLLATTAGVFRVGDGLDHVGLDDARDVAAAVPLAATADGCYRLGPGWTRDLDGPFDVVAAAGDRAHAAAGTDLYERADGEWAAAEWPVAAPPADLAYGEAVYAVAADGTVLADAGDGWRRRSIGLPDVSACALL